ncbi:MarR family transcriptional regulator [Tardiphaga alba]|uniref:MarR family transcriptional regulator n=1 Tax=Tardiphaga alba TaxID=340268 RepID=A0ABX8ACC0_9BRAD|nr:MarR family transcriptional regulator [Tardiphaga alba]QUS41147.1 MarR family transcriptional regulator [Tardiphaga alba]
MPAPSDLDAHLGYWLRFVSNHVSSAFAAELAQKDVSVAEWVLMRLLYGTETMAPSLLAERIGMTRGAITKSADRLIARDLIVRTANPDDGRAQKLALTAAGRRLVPVLAALADRNDAAFFADLSAAERTNLERILKKIIDKRGLAIVPID